MNYQTRCHQLIKSTVATAPKEFRTSSVENTMHGTEYSLFSLSQILRNSHHWMLNTWKVSPWPTQLPLKSCRSSVCHTLPPCLTFPANWTLRLTIPRLWSWAWALEILAALCGAQFAPHHQKTREKLRAIADRSLCSFCSKLGRWIARTRLQDF